MSLARSAMLIVFGLFPVVATAQQAIVESVDVVQPDSTALADAPMPQIAVQDTSMQSQAQRERPPFPGPVGRILREPTLTAHDKLELYKYQVFGPWAVVKPAFGAALRMATPPSDYPHDWRSGAEAFGRNYGNSIAVQTAKGTAQVITELALHEDQRYVPSDSSNVFARTAHSIGFTFVDRNDNGSRAIAWSSFAGAAAGGFVGNAYLPSGYNDVSHAGQRIGIEFGLTAASNVAREFYPTWAPLFMKLRIPKIIPSWWVPEKN